MLTPEECGFKFGKSYYDVTRPSYAEIAAKFATVLHTDTIGTYQGDDLFLLADGDRRGLLIQGFGSCSGCDVLQAVYTPSDAQDLIDSMIANVHWEDSAGALARWIDGRDWKGQWVWHEKDFRKFVRDALCVLHGGYDKFLEPGANDE